MEFQTQIEALLFVAGEEGISAQNLADLLTVDKPAIEQQIERFKENLDANENSALTILKTGELYQLVTKSDYHDLLKQFFSEPPARLSQAALEVAAIIAYEQPITRIEIDQVRGVQSSGTITTLLNHQLIQEAGRKDVAGRPILYETTEFFLNYFGLDSIKELPKIKLPEDESESSNQNDLFEQFKNALEQE